MKTISGFNKGKGVKLLIDTSDLKSQIECHIAKCNHSQIDVCGVFESDGFRICYE